MASPARDFRFAIDRGGTFTDVYAETPAGVRVLKLLSEDPSNYADAPREGKQSFPNPNDPAPYSNSHHAIMILSHPRDSSGVGGCDESAAPSQREVGYEPD